MTAISALMTQQVLVNVNSARKGLTVFNQSPATVYVSTITGFAKANAPIVIGPQKRWVLPIKYTGILYCIWDAATGRAQVTEV
jgi:hypothetical protein